MSLTVADMPALDREIAEDAPRTIRGSIAGADCANCPFSRLGRPNQPVTGEGWERPNWIVVGEGPGQNEVIQSRPFVGSSGRLVNEALSKIGVAREALWVTNATLCQSPSGANDHMKKLARQACAPRLQQEMAQFPGKPILALGAVAAQGFCGEKFSITQMAGAYYEIDVDGSGQTRAVVPSIHPAAILRGGSSSGGGGSHTVDLAFWNLLYDAQKVNLLARGADIKFTDDIETECENVQRAEQLIFDFVRDARRLHKFACDTETYVDNPKQHTALAPVNAKLSAIGLATPERAISIAWALIVQSPRAKNLLNAIFADSTITKLFHNRIYDVPVLQRHGFTLNGPLHCTMLMHHSAFPGLSHNLQRVTTQFYATPPWKAEHRHGQGTIEELLAYNARDTLATARIEAPIAIVIKRSQAERTYEVDLAMAHAATIMHVKGVPINREINDQLRNGFRAHIDHARAELNARVLSDAVFPRFKERLAFEQARKQRKHDPLDLDQRIQKRIGEMEKKPFQFLIDSGDHIVAFLKACGVPLSIQTASGRISTEKDILESFVNYAEVRALLTYRENAKLLSTYCLAPGTRVLTSDLRWVAIETLKVHDELIGFDEKIDGKQTKYHRSYVEATSTSQLPCYLITTDRAAVIASSNHLWVARSSKASGHTRDWVRTCDLKPGNVISTLTDPWEEDRSWEAGFIAGFADGEGCLSDTRVVVSQNNGPTLDNIMSFMRAKGFEFGLCYKHDREGRCVNATLKGGFGAGLKFVGQIRPPRLLAKAHELWEGRATGSPGNTPAVVLSVEEIGMHPVVAIRTSTKTFIAEGMLTHNCERMFDRDYPNGKHLYGFCDENSRAHPRWSVHKITGRWGSEAPVCFDGETEILTENGWARFDKLPRNTRVAQYHLDRGVGAIDFVMPTQYVKKQHDGEMIKLTGQAIDLFVTPDHRFPVRYRRKSRTWRDIRADEWRNDYHLPVAGNYVGGEWAPDRWYLAFLCAAQADGSWNGYGWDFNFTEKRKVKRLHTALTQLGLSFHVSERTEPNPFRPGETRRRRRTYVHQSSLGTETANLLGLEEKKPGKGIFGSWLLELTTKAMTAFRNEVMFWDGCHERDSQFSSSQKTSADWVQIACMLTGRRAKVRRYDGSDLQVEPNWQVDVAKRTNKRQRGAPWYITTNQAKKSAEDWKGTVYCVSVPSSYIIVRRNGRAVIAGNCQNVPKADKKKGRPNLRSQVVAPYGRAFVAFDAKQLEARLIALMSGDPFLLNIFHNDRDIHTEFAKIVWPEWESVPVDERKVRRDLIKRPEYGAFYAGSIETLWKSVVRDYPSVTIGMIGKMVQVMKTHMPGVTAWHQNMMRVADQQGEIRSMILGRRRCFPIKQFDLSEVVNFPIQSSGADLINLGLMDIMPRLPADAFPILQIHDAVVFECDEDDQDLVKSLVVQSFTREVEYNGNTMAFPVDAKSGKSWDVVN
jgi:uracil-DNA glycosylase family 4